MTVHHDLEIDADGNIIVPDFDPVQAMLYQAEYEAMRRSFEDAVAKYLEDSREVPHLSGTIQKHTDGPCFTRSSAKRGL